MILNIGNKEYELRFGIKFIETIDKLYTQERDGIELGLGVELVTVYLNAGRPTALINIIKAGTAHLNSKPSNKAIEEYLEELAKKDDNSYEELFEEVLEAMEQAPFLKRQMKAAKQNG